MVTVISALGRALSDLAQPRILAVLVVPMLGAILVWSVLAFFFWDAWTSAFRALVDDTGFGRWLAGLGAAWVLEGVGVLVVIVALVPAVLITALIVTELIAMPVIVSIVGRRYPGLEKRAGGSAAGSVANASLAVVAFACLWLVTLPLWFTGIGAIVVPALNSAYLNQRLFRYDALSEHASPEEYESLVKRERLGLFGLGLTLAPLYYVPLVNLAAPVIAGLAFTHYCLSALAESRKR
jgi:CysZ protein